MKTIEWNLLVVCYLFLGGLSAGLFFVSALATLVRKKDSLDLNRIALCHSWSALSTSRARFAAVDFGRPLYRHVLALLLRLWAAAAAVDGSSRGRSCPSIRLDRLSWENFGGNRCAVGPGRRFPASIHFCLCGANERVLIDCRQMG